MTTASNAATVDTLDVDEAVIRRDEVIFDRTSSDAFWPYPADRYGGVFDPCRAIMVVSNKRLVFSPPINPWLARLHKVMYHVPGLNLVAMLLLGQRPSLTWRQAFELKDIDRFWTWKPEFALPPVFQIGQSSWSFALMAGGRSASKEEVRDHFSAVEAAWIQARKVLTP